MPVRSAHRLSLKSFLQETNLRARVVGQQWYGGTVTPGQHLNCSISTTFSYFRGRRSRQTVRRNISFLNAGTVSVSGDENAENGPAMASRVRGDKLYEPM